jgi:Fe-S oxidoreductase
MATYKAEFLSHYHEHRPRPRQALSMGRIGQWAPLAAALPGLANSLAPLGARLAGIAPQRSLPRFAARSFRRQFEALQHGRRDPSRTGGARRGDPVLLFPDTFSNYFRPAGALAAARVLEAAGCRVDLPRERLCCGRPYYDFGMLDEAKAALERVVAALAPQLEAGIPVVVLEPGCLSVFRDELASLLPDNACASRLAQQATSLGELLERRGWKPRAAPASVLLHTHCHQKSLWGARHDAALLAAGGCEVQAPDFGCCGMAGAFGMRPDTYETSVRIGESGLLPAVRAAPPDALVVASGFSCREQIEGLAGRPTLHVAEVLARGLA